MRKAKPETTTDLDRFAAEALTFVMHAVPEANFGQQTSVSARIVETFRGLFDAEGSRVSGGPYGEN